MKLGNGLIVSLAVIAASATHLQASYLFHLTDLGIPSPMTASYGLGINSSGQVVGYALDTTMMAGPPPVVYSTSANGLYTDPMTNRGNGIGSAINDSGQVAGQNNATQAHAVRLNPGQTTASSGTDLGTLGGSSSSGIGINASGQVVGWASTSGGNQFAFRTSPTGLVSDPGTNLGTLSGGNYSIAQGINASGQTTGYSDAGGGNQHAFRTTATGLVSDPGTDLGVIPGYTGSNGYAINASGQVAGYSYSNAMMSGFPPHAFRTTATGLISDPGADLGTLPGDTISEALAINDAGWVVGFSGSHAMLQDGTTMYDLGTLLDGSGSGWNLQPMFGINNSDQIVGSAYSTVDGMYHAVRLDPTSVPEPSCLTLLGAAAIGTLRPQRTKR